MESNHPVVIVGMGEMGGSFARGLLRLGHTVVPVLRSTNSQDIAAAYPEPLLALVTVGEADLDSALTNLPTAWKRNTGLVQNELLPRSWRLHDIINPTVAVVWFEKKRGKPESPIISTPVFGDAAELLVASLGAIDMPAHVVDDETELRYELIRKNVYILTVNIGGLVSGGDVHDLWYDHHGLAEQVAAEVIDLQEWLVGEPLDRDQLLAGLVEAIDADPHHGVTGRSAPARLARAINHADRAGLDVPRLREIAAGT